jgi:glyoxylase-like metal-dependent hydrolase (beta-lactamase superfamily II)
MENWVLHPLHVGTIRRDKSIFTYLQNIGTPIDAPVLAWHLERNGHHILVDTGGHDPAEGEFHPPYSQEADQSLVARLAAWGVRPEDIEVLILTHLHWDHASNCHLFPRARVIVQQEELRYAVAPLAPHRWAYKAHPPLSLGANRYEVLDGDAEVIKGVSVHLTPGHTPGLQGVAVQTAGGTYFIASDNVPLSEMWNASEKYGVPHWPGSIHVNLEAYYASLQRIEDLGDFVLPSHDWRALDRTEYA